MVANSVLIPVRDFFNLERERERERARKGERKSKISKCDIFFMSFCIVAIAHAIIQQKKLYSITELVLSPSLPPPHSHSFSLIHSIK